ncbi:VWA domain-containing protein [Candidatus Binatia bacterium]|nr:VWA domain-containing protein [Candidatus Binatia bacterium]
MRTRLLQFIDALRAAGVAPSVAETLDAVAAAAQVGIDRATLREALAATLVKDHAERHQFDDTFDRFFAVPRRPGKRTEYGTQTGEGLGTARSDETGTGTPLPGMKPAPRIVGKPTATSERRQRDERKSADADAAHRLARAKAAQNRPFAEMDPIEVEECDALVEELARRFRAHLRRRLRMAPRGRLDLRRTIRQSIATGGAMIDPAFRFRRPGRPDLIALCDHSYSVITASRFFVSLLIPAGSFFRRVHVFAYVDTPVEVSQVDGHLVPHEPLDLYARSDFGRVLDDLWAGYARLFTRSTVLVVLGDARNNRRPPRADLLARMRYLVRRIVWLNPEAPARWNTGDSVMRAYETACDAVLPAATLRELMAALRLTFGRP